MKLSVAKYIRIQNVVNNNDSEERSQVVWYSADEDKYFVTSASRRVGHKTRNDFTVDLVDLVKETYIFDADQDGFIKEYIERDGSIKDILSHMQSLREAGFNFIENSKGEFSAIVLGMSHLEELIYLENANQGP